MDEKNCRVVYKLSKDANNVIEHLTFSELLQYFNKVENYYYIEFHRYYKKDGCWKLDFKYLDGKEIEEETKEEETEANPYNSLPPIGDIFKLVVEAHPQRKQSIASLLIDIFAGKDVRKPNLSIVRNKK